MKKVRLLFALLVLLLTASFIFQVGFAANMKADPRDPFVKSFVKLKDGSFSESGTVEYEGTTCCIVNVDERYAYIDKVNWEIPFTLTISRIPLTSKDYDRVFNFSDEQTHYVKDYHYSDTGILLSCFDIPETETEKHDAQLNVYNQIYEKYELVECIFEFDLSSIELVQIYSGDGNVTIANFTIEQGFYDFRTKNVIESGADSEFTLQEAYITSIDGVDYPIYFYEASNHNNIEGRIIGDVTDTIPGYDGNSNAILVALNSSGKYIMRVLVPQGYNGIWFFVDSISRAEASQGNKYTTDEYDESSVVYPVAALDSFSKYQKFEVNMGNYHYEDRGFGSVAQKPNWKPVLNQLFTYDFVDINDNTKKETYPSYRTVYDACEVGFNYMNGKSSYWDWDDNTWDYLHSWSIYFNRDVAIGYWDKEDSIEVYNPLVPGLSVRPVIFSVRQTGNKLLPELIGYGAIFEGGEQSEDMAVEWIREPEKNEYLIIGQLVYDGDEPASLQIVVDGTYNFCMVK